MPINVPSSLSPRNSGRNSSGFVQLSNTRTGSDTMPDEIPLSTVKSRASSTGARRANQVPAALSDESTTDEKHHHFHRGRRRKPKEVPLRKNTGDSEEVKLNAMGRLYTKVVNMATSLRYLIYIVPVALALAVPLIVLPLTGHREDLPVGNQRVERDGERVVVQGPPLFKVFLWVEISWLTLWAGKLVAWLLPPVFMFFCGVVSSGTRKYATVLRNLTYPLSFFFWALASWLSFQGLFQRPKDSGITWVRNFERVLGASFASSAVYLGEKAIVQLIGISYHQRSFANRIKASKTDIRLLGMLYDASRALFPMYCPEFSDEDYIINDSIKLKLGRKGAKGGGTATPMRLVGDVGRIGDKVTSVFGNIASEITGKQVFNPNSAHSIVIEALEKVRSSEALGRRIWMSFAVEGQESLHLEDIIEVLGPDHRDSAEAAFQTIDVDENGDIALDEMVRKVVDIGKERKAITEGMKDISQALQVFDKVLQFVVLLIVIFIFLAFFQSSFITTLATAGTALLSLSFVFAVTTQEFLGSCIFLFVKHPYDVGDRVDIFAAPEKIQLQVEKISLLYTVFVRIDKMQVVQTPNIQLNNMWIENVTRSNAMKECIDLNVSYDTSFEDIELLRLEMEKFVRSPDNSRDFQPDFSIGVAGVGDLDKMQLKILIKHKSNWHNDNVRATRRSKFICALAAALKKIPIYNPGGGYEALGSVGNPAYNVSVSDEIAAANRDAASKSKEEKRMVPTPAAQAEVDAGEETNLASDATNQQRPGSEDWFERHDKTLIPRDQTRVSLESNMVDPMKRGESHRGLRKAGDTLSPTTTNTTSLGAGPGSVASRTGSRRRYDEEAQLGSPTTMQPQGGFMTTPVSGGVVSPPGPAPVAAPGYSGLSMTPVQEIPNPFQAQQEPPQPPRGHSLTHPQRPQQPGAQGPPPQGPPPGPSGQRPF